MVWGVKKPDLGPLGNLLESISDFLESISDFPDFIFEEYSKFEILSLLLRQSDPFLVFRPTRRTRLD